MIEPCHDFHEKCNGALVPTRHTLPIQSKYDNFGLEAIALRSGP